MKKIFLVASVLFLAVAACKKDKDDKDCPITAESIAGSYTLVNVKYKLSAGTPEADVTNDVLEPCQRDDVYVLNANFSFGYQDAGTVCDPDASTSGTWSLNGNTVTIQAISGTIVSYNCKTLVVSASDQLQAGDKLTTTLVKQ